LSKEAAAKTILGGLLAFLLAVALVSSSTVFRAHKPRATPVARPPQWQYEDFQKVDEDEDRAVYRVGTEEVKP
jgi:hypothetical protein